MVDSRLSTVVLHSHFPQARALVVEAARRALAATGETIAERTREAMTPGHFLETGLSQEETAYEQLTPDQGQVHIATDYAVYPEFGTAHEAARPVLQPAISQTWPHGLYDVWDQAMGGLRERGGQVLPPAPAPGAARPPVLRSRPGGGGAGGP